MYFKETRYCLACYLKCGYMKHVDHWDRNNTSPAPPQDIHVLIPRICEYVAYMATETLPIKKLRVLRWG